MYIIYIMDNFIEYLMNFYYPINQNRPKLEKEDEIMRGMCLGIVGIRPCNRKYYNPPGITHAPCRKLILPKYKEMYERTSDFFYKNINDFKFTSIQYNYNNACAKHKDGNNVGQSYIIAFGNYTGGRLIVYDEEGENPEYIDIKEQFYSFNGSIYPHEVEPFTGNRVSLVFFNLLNK